MKHINIGTETLNDGDTFKDNTKAMEDINTNFKSAEYIHKVKLIKGNWKYYTTIEERLLEALLQFTINNKYSKEPSLIIVNDFDLIKLKAEIKELIIIKDNLSIQYKGIRLISSKELKQNEIIIT